MAIRVVYSVNNKNAQKEYDGGLQKLFQHYTGNFKMKFQKKKEKKENLLLHVLFPELL